MQHTVRMGAAILGGLAVVTLGALSAGAVEGQVAPISASGTPEMSLGVTSTETTPSDVPAVAKAAPAIKGPAK